MSGGSGMRPANKKLQENERDERVDHADQVGRNVDYITKLI